MSVYPASKAQTDLIKSLTVQLSSFGIVSDLDEDSIGILDKGEASDIIGKMIAQVKAAKVSNPRVSVKNAPAPRVVVPGAYDVNGTYYMAKPARSSDRVHAYLITATGEHEYAGLASRFIPATAVRITDPAIISVIGESHGYCGCCGRLLKAKHSVYRGIGPICIKNYF